MKKVSSICNRPLSCRHYHLSFSHVLLSSLSSLSPALDGWVRSHLAAVMLSPVQKQERFSALTLAAAGAKYSPEPRATCCAHRCSNTALFAPAKIYLLIKSPSFHSTNLLGRFTGFSRSDYIEILVC